MTYRLLSRPLCVLLALCLLACTLSVTVVAESEITQDTMGDRVDGWEEFCYAPKTAWSYSYTLMKIYANFEAEMIKVPEGYTGYVMELDGKPELGFTVDFTDLHIPMSTVKAIHFRVYYPDTTKEVRAAKADGSGWLMRYVAANPNTWDDVVLDTPSELQKMANGDGTLGAFGFGIRFYDGVSNHHAWIDAIEVELIPGDTVPPVITYEGETDINWTAGKAFFVNATAYDEQEEAEMPLVYEWEGNALDADGLPVEGDHICHVTSTDNFGNKSEIKLTVHVGAKDTEAPKLGFRALTIRTYVNTYADMLVIPVTDNTDIVSAVNTWSEESLDPAGRLIGGTHTLTVTATDLTGNVTTTVVTVIVE